MSGLFNLNILSNTVWNTTYHVYNDIVINSSATLTISDTVYLAGNARLVVRPGGKLIVDDGTLTSACPGEMWQGISLSNEELGMSL